MLRAVLNKSRRKYPTKQQLYGHLPPIKKTIQIIRTRHVNYSWKCKDELASDVLFLWTPSHERAKFRRPARTYLQLLYANRTCSQEDLPKRWMIETNCQSGLGKSVQARHDNDGLLFSMYSPFFTLQYFICNWIYALIKQATSPH